MVNPILNAIPAWIDGIVGIGGNYLKRKEAPLRFNLNFAWNQMEYYDNINQSHLTSLFQHCPWLQFGDPLVLLDIRRLWHWAEFKKSGPKISFVLGLQKGWLINKGHFFLFQPFILQPLILWLLTFNRLNIFSWLNPMALQYELQKNCYLTNFEKLLKTTSN